jgi:UDP-N-acetylmuramoylalanine--D-glutamate ligase
VIVINLASFAGRKVAVMGLGKSGIATAEALRAAGAEVWAWDDSAAGRKAAEARGLTPIDLTQCDWRQVSSLVLSPGIPHTYPKPNPVATLAKQHNVEIIGDIELLARSERQARYIGITGTNGKSTTTALIGHILRKAGRRIAVGGNIGTPVLALDPLGDGLYVLEMSSYQLELTPSLAFDVAILINITPDHLDRHGGMDGYVAAKRLIFRGQGAKQTAVVGVDDEHSRHIQADLSARGGQIVIPISITRPVDGGAYVKDGILYDATRGTATRVADLNPIPTLPGSHNWQNAAAAYAACRAVGVEAGTIADALATYPGLAHRQELVAVVDGIPFINDSKATNADAAEKALVCYDAIYWIAGGLPKEGGIDALTPLFPRIRRAYLIGQAAADFARTLGDAAPHEIVGTLEAAVAAAHRDARRDKISGAVVLLSPACASFDQFANFEARGDAFRALAQALPGARRPAAGGRA